MNSTIVKDLFEKRQNLITISIISFVLLLFCDNYLSSSLDVMSDIVKNPAGLILFASILIVSIIFSYFVLEGVFKLLEKKGSILSKYRKAFRIMQISLYSLSLLLLVDLFSDFKYYTINLNLIVLVSYGFSLSISLLASLKLFSWYRVNRSRFVILFGLTLFFIFINSLLSIFLFEVLLIEKPSEFDLSTPNIFDFECEENTINCYLKENLLMLQNYSLAIYFVLFWMCTILLLHHHINKVGKIKFFALVALPLILFYFQFVYTYEDFFTISDELRFDENIAFAIQLFIATLLTAACGILFGWGLLSIANLLKISIQVERFLKVAAVGVVTFFISANATVASGGMPPFGVPNLIFLPFSSILIYVGVFYSITSIANDISIKKFIKNSTYNELKIMGNLAESQMLDDMKLRVLSMTKKFSSELQEKSKLEEGSSEDNIKDYLNDVIDIYTKQKQNQI